MSISNEFWFGSAGDAGYRYYRLYVTVGNSGYFTQVSTLELRVDGVNQVPTMTNYTTSGVTVSASSEYKPGGITTYSAWKSGDNIVSTFWDANNTSPAWLRYDFGAAGAFVLGDYRVGAGVALQEQWAPNSWTMQGSTDNSAWDTLDTVSGQTSWSAGQIRTFTLD